MTTPGMTRGLGVLVCLLAAQASASERTRVVVMPVSTSSPKLKPVAASVAEQLLTELGRSGTYDVVGESDVSAVLGLERQKEMLGCADSSTTCLAEISSALGAPWLVTGNLAQVGKTMRVDVKLIRARDGKALFRDGRNLADEGAIFDVVGEIAKALLPALAKASSAEPKPAAVATPATTTAATATTTASTASSAGAGNTATTPGAGSPKAASLTPASTVGSPQGVDGAATVEAGPPSAPGRLGPWLTAGAGGVGLIGGVALFLVGGQTRTRMQQAVAMNPGQKADSSTPTYGDAEAAYARANALQAGGIGLGVAGVCALGGGLAWWALGTPDAAASPTVSLAPLPGGVQVQGSF